MLRMWEGIFRLEKKEKGRQREEDTPDREGWDEIAECQRWRWSLDGRMGSGNQQPEL